VTPALWQLVLLGALCAVVGSVGGIGGASVLVPVLLAAGMEPRAAAPLGLLTVAAGSLAAGARQLDAGLVHHRLGLTIELAASVGAVAGALASASLPQTWLARTLAVAAIIGAVATATRSGIRNRPVGVLDAEPPGEWPGTLGGQYSLDGQVVPYQAQRVPAGMAAALVAGAVAGLSGVGGGFLKTPAMSEIMRVPARVAAATTTFTLGITAAVGLLIYTGQGRVALDEGAAVVLGALVGGLLGARAQGLLPVPVLRRVTGALLLVIAAIVLWRSR
jgi:uncharacterized protein